MAAPVAGSGSCPAWMAAVSKRIASSIGNSWREAEDLTNLDTTANGPWVAVLGQWRKGCLRLPVPYVDAVKHAGLPSKVFSPFELLHSETPPPGLEVVTDIDPYDATYLEGASGLVVCGGGDIDPALYGRERDPRTHNVSQKRDRFELTYLKAALDQDMPVLAICRGMQLLNVHLGGTLTQHLMDDPKKLDHYVDRPLSEPAHEVSVKENSLAADALGETVLQVNTHHHQGLDDVGPSLEQVGWSEDGVLEIVESREQTWVIGVQWHPEAMVPVHEPQTRLFQAFGDAVRAFDSGIADSNMQARSA